MTKKQNKQKKSTGKASKKSNQSSVGSIAKSVLATGGPILAKALMGMLTGGIPFPTSGARAIAAPDPGSVMQLSAPSANGAMVRTTKAKTANTRTGIRVTHREYITDVVHSTADEFELLEFENVNPVNQSLFPWLATIATRFETYRFETLRFIYEPQTATTSLGTVMMAIDYDANDAPPIDKTQMMSYKGAVRSPAWFASVNNSDRSDLQKQKNYYTLGSSTTTATSDGRLTNLGKFILAFQSESAAYTAGELYVEYDVHLDTPQLQDGVGSSTAVSWSQIVASGTLLKELTGPSAGNGILPVEGIVDTGGESYLDFGLAGNYLLIASVLPTATVAGTGSALFQIDVPTGSLAQLKLIANTVFYQETNGVNQAIIGVYHVFIPNPGELVHVAFDYDTMSSQTFSALWTTVVLVDNAGMPTYSRFPETAGSVLKIRSLRLLEKRRAAMLSPTVSKSSNSDNPSISSRSAIVPGNRSRNLRRASAEIQNS